MSLSCCRTSSSYRVPIISVVRRTLGTTTTTTTTTAHESSSSPPPLKHQQHPPPPSHFKITLTRSGISLGAKIQGTLLSLGFHKRFQTVYMPHSPEVAGKILRVKELVKVENVRADEVLTRREQRERRRASKGFEVVGRKLGRFMAV